MMTAPVGTLNEKAVIINWRSKERKKKGGVYVGQPPFVMK
jgi:hypothetical protein